LTAVENDYSVGAAHVAGAVRDKQNGGTAGQTLDFFYECLITRPVKPAARIIQQVNGRIFDVGACEYQLLQPPLGPGTLIDGSDPRI
jgi:hypothetical protein